MAEKIEITRDTPLQVGDIIEIHFKTLSPVWIRAAHIAVIETAVKQRKEFDLLSSQYTESTIILKLRVVKNPVVTAGLITVLVVSLLISYIVFCVVDKIYKIVNVPGGGSITSGLWAVVAGLGIFAFLKLRK